MARRTAPPLELYPPTNAREAARLATLGDAAVPHLRAVSGEKPALATARVRALAAIGTDAALDALATFAPDPRTPVRQSLVDAWGRFDRAEFARRVLADWTLLAVPDAPSLSGIEALGALESLSVHRAPTGLDLTPLAGLTNLRALSLGDTSVSDLAPLAGLSRLTHLTIEGARGVSDLAPLAGLSRLEVLLIDELPGVTDFGPLAGLSALKRVRLVEALGMRDLRWLAGLYRLEHLLLSGSTAVTDASPLAGLRALTFANLELPGVRDLAPLAELPALATLILDGVPDEVPTPPALAARLHVARWHTRRP